MRFNFGRKKNLESILKGLETTIEDLEAYTMDAVEQADIKKAQADKLLFEVQDLDSQAKRATKVSGNIRKLLAMED